MIRANQNFCLLLTIYHAVARADATGIIGSYLRVIYCPTYTAFHGQSGHPAWPLDSFGNRPGAPETAQK